MFGPLMNIVTIARDYTYVVWWQLSGAAKHGRIRAREYPAAPNATPVILLPGVYEKWHFMKQIADLLANQRYAVHIIDGLGYNIGGVEEMSAIVHDYIKKHALEHCYIVAHSKGGLIGKYLMTISDPTTIKGMVTINTPFSGSRHARLLPLRTIRIFLPTSTLITALSAKSEVNRKITSIYGTYDPHIPESSYLEGATNIQLNIAGHFRILHSKKVHHAILDALAKMADASKNDV